MANTKRNPLARAFELLRYLAREQLDGIGVREAATALSVAPSTAHHLLAALATEGVLQQEARSGRYTLGLELLQFAHHTINQLPFRRASMPHLRKLADTCGEAAHLSLYVRERAEIVTVAGVESTHPVRYVLDLYARRPLHVGAAGWAVLAFLPDTEQDALLGRRGVRGTRKSGVLDLAQELATVRKRGYALTFGTRIQGAVGLAVPLFDSGSAVLGAVGIAMPEQRFDRGGVGRLVKPLSTCARNLMSEIGAAAGPGHGKSRPVAAKRTELAGSP